MRAGQRLATTLGVNATASFSFFEVSMELIINRLFALGVSDPACIVADCVDSGRLPLLMDYMSARDLRLLGVHQHPKVEGQAHQVCKLNTPPLEDWGRLFYALYLKLF